MSSNACRYHGVGSLGGGLHKSVKGSWGSFSALAAKHGGGIPVRMYSCACRGSRLRLPRLRTYIAWQSVLTETVLCAWLQVGSPTSNMRGGGGRAGVGSFASLTSRSSASNSADSLQRRAPPAADAANTHHPVASAGSTVVDANAAPKQKRKRRRKHRKGGV